jgi:hypothetical protein
MGIRKFYDMEIGGVGGVYVVTTWNDSKKEIIECECGTHLLQVQSETDFYLNSDQSTQVQQSFYLAMFSYGNQKRRFFARLKIAFNYLRTGKMFSDQLTLSPDEAKKLSDFICKAIEKEASKNQLK